VNPQTRIANKRRPRFLNGIDVSAFLAIQIAILAMFLAELTPVDRLRPVADLLRVDHPSLMPGANRENALSVTVTRDGNVYFRTSPD
jgi:hypothetical protein